LCGDGDLLDAVDEAVEFGVARVDAAFEVGDGLALFLLEARGDAVVLGEVEVDDFDGAGGAAVAFGGTLEEAAGQISGFGEEVEADLGDVGSGGDVDQVVLGVDVEGVGAREMEKGFIDVFEVPGIAKFDLVEADFGLGGDGGYVLLQIACEGRVAKSVEEFETMDEEIGLAAEGDGRAPGLPAVVRLAGVEGGAEEADDDVRGHGTRL